MLITKSRLRCLFIQFPSIGKFVASASYRKPVALLAARWTGNWHVIAERVDGSDDFLIVYATAPRKRSILRLKRLLFKRLGTDFCFLFATACVCQQKFCNKSFWTILPFANIRLYTRHHDGILQNALENVLELPRCNFHQNGSMWSLAFSKSHQRRSSTSSRTTNLLS